MPDSTNQQPGAVKPGVTTTEFWVTVLTQALAAAVAITSLVKSHFSPTSADAAIPAVAVLAATVAQVFYSHGRAGVKAAAQAAAGQSAAAVQSAQASHFVGAPPPRIGSDGNAEMSDLLSRLSELIATYNSGKGS